MRLKVCKHCQAKFTSQNSFYCSRKCLNGETPIPVSGGWREIPGYSMYEAASDGRVRKRGRKDIKPKKDRDGYMRMNMRKDGRSTVANTPVHRIICLAFHGLPPTERHQAAHRDGIRTHNGATNIRWATPKENNADMVLHGTKRVGDNHGMSILTESQVIAIRARHSIARKRNKTYGVLKSLAREYGVTHCCIQDVVYGRSWVAAIQKEPSI